MLVPTSPIPRPRERAPECSRYCRETRLLRRHPIGHEFRCPLLEVKAHFLFHLLFKATPTDEVPDATDEVRKGVHHSALYAVCSTAVIAPLIRCQLVCSASSWRFPERVMR
jgi:hypothetical protein